MSFFEELQSQGQELDRRGNQDCIGIVSDRKIDPQIGPVVRFTLLDQDGKVSPWVPVKQLSCAGMSFFHLPRIGERMLYRKMPNGPESGFADGAFYNSSVACPVQKADTNFSIVFDDGSSLTVNPGTDIHLVATNNLVTDINGTTTIGANSTVTLTAGGVVKITAPSINLNGVIISSEGNVLIPGTLTVTGYSNLNGGGTATPKMVNQDGSGGGS